MPATSPIGGDAAPSGARPLTGRVVFAAIFTFFATIFAANAVMLHLATSTFRGVETDSAYREGLRFNEEAARAAAQAARGWRVEAQVRREDRGGARVRVAARDRDGTPLAGLGGSAVLARPADKSLDRTAPLVAGPGGTYEASFAELLPGQWDLVITLEQGGERVFLSRGRVILP